MFKGKITLTIAAFLNEIGVPVNPGEVPDDTFLPGILVNGAGLIIDENKLKYPGDMLHEAGHIAVMTSEQREKLYNDVSKNPGDEMATLAWSWAALQYLKLSPEVVFHPNGYKGDSQWLIDTFSSGGDLGVPLLQWMGLTVESNKEEAGVAAFPAMRKWLRD